MHTYGKDIKVFTANAHPKLARDIANLLGVPIGLSKVERFSDGEINTTISETVRGSDVFLVQPTSQPVNEHLMELLIMIDAFKRASAGRITAVMPYFGYARQDRKAKARDPISAKLVADLIVAAGAHRVITMDLHATQIQGFFNIPVDHLIGLPIICEYYEKMLSGRKDDVVVVSPDVGSVARTRRFAQKMDLPLAIVDKRRTKVNMSEVMNIIGDIKGKTVLMIDDLIDTAGTLVNAANALMEHEAKEVFACATHGVLSGPALERIENSPLKELVVLDTINVPEEKLVGKIKTLSVAAIFAEAIGRIHDNLSVSTLFV